MTLSYCEQKRAKLATLVEGTDVEIADAVIADLESLHSHAILECDGQFHAYNGTNWYSLPEHEIKNLIFLYDLQISTSKKAIKLNRNRCDSILSIMCGRVRDPEFFLRAPVGINCRSGFITFDESGEPKLAPHMPEHRQRFCLPGAWNPATEWRNAELLPTLMEGCFGIDEDRVDKIALISELCGIAALGAATHLSAPKAFVLYGQSAANGKSEMLAMVSGLLPEVAVCAIPPTRFVDERMLAQLAGCSLNACGELGTPQAVAADVFKSVVTGDKVLAKEIYRPAVFFKPVALHLFATNILPGFRNGLDRGVQRRLLVVPFNRSIPENERIARIGSRIATEEADALLSFAVEGASRALANGCYTEPRACREALRDWVYNSDAVLAWMESCTEFSITAKTSCKAAHEDFKAWAQDEGIEQRQIPLVNNFTQRLLMLDSRLSKSRTSTQRFIDNLQLRGALP
jgi:P4 family phage/plasmid primase-like protien